MLIFFMDYAVQDVQGSRSIWTYLSGTCTLIRKEKKVFTTEPCEMLCFRMDLFSQNQTGRSGKPENPWKSQNTSNAEAMVAAESRGDIMHSTENPTAGFDRLEDLQDFVSGCEKCKLSRTRRQVVFGEGNSQAEVMFIGEGPGKTEDEIGRPFVGRAGDLLTRIIENGMGFKRSEVYIANIVKCRPTVDLKMIKDRPPEPEETAACSPYLLEQIRLIAPKVIVTLGNPATKFILNTNQGITKMRGTWGQFQGIPVMPTYHPSYVLRNGGEKSPLRRDVWEDIKKVMMKIGRPLPK